MFSLVHQLWELVDHMFYPWTCLSDILKKENFKFSCLIITSFYNVIQEILKRKVTKPYSPIADGSSVEATWKEGISTWSPPQVPSSVPLSSTFGSSTDKI
jgi:hypothetical protein